MKKLRKVLAGVAVAALLSPAGTATTLGDGQWHFTVYLDDKPVGHHRFTLTEDPRIRRLRSEARFTVRLLMINAYSYEHEANESWQGDCLETLRASTDDNGDRSSVLGTVRKGRFELRKGETLETLPACVMSFAYWNPRMLQQTRLLNPQTGDYTAVRIVPQGMEAIPVSGRAVSAQRYRLEAGDFQIDLWYADGGRWVALDSLLANGRRLRYRIE